MILALIGNDGSGKTTNRYLIYSRLKAMGIPVIVMQGFDHYILQFFKDGVSRILGSKMKDLQKSYSSGAFSYSHSRSNALVFALWPFFILFDCILIYFKTRMKSRSMIIFDRYFYDHVVSFEELGYCSRWVRKLFFLIPAPDIGFVFDSCPDLAYQRKKNDHLADSIYYVRQRERYLSLAAERGFAVIDTSDCSPRETSGRIMKALFEHPKFRQLAFTTRNIPQLLPPSQS